MSDYSWPDMVEILQKKTNMFALIIQKFEYIS